MRALVALGLAILCVTAGASHAVNPIYDVALDASSETETAVSGFSGSKYVIGATPGFGVRGVGWFEQADKPCKFESYMRHINDGGKTVFGKYWNGCTRSWGSEKTVVLDDKRLFVRGVAVCDSGNLNARIKGIEFYKAKVWKTKTVVEDVYPTKREERTNCKTWKKPVFCPDGKVATSLVIHVNLRVGPSEAKGMSLKCQKVTWS